MIRISYFFIKQIKFYNKKCFSSNKTNSDESINFLNKAKDTSFKILIKEPIIPSRQNKKRTMYIMIRSFASRQVQSTKKQHCCR